MKGMHFLLSATQISFIVQGLHKTVAASILTLLPSAMLTANAEYKIPPEMQKMADEYEKAQRQVEAKYRDMPPELSNKPVVAYIRGGQGISLPLEKEILAPYIPTTTQVQEAKDQAEQMLATSLQHSPEKDSAYKPIETCLDSSNERLQIKGMKQGPSVYLDTLYIREEDVPLKPHEAFGTNIQLRTFRRDPRDPLSQAISAYPEMITCLPFRIRIIDGAVFFAKGGAALKNYDGNPNGSGVVNAAMESLIRSGGWK